VALITLGVCLVRIGSIPAAACSAVAAGCAPGVTIRSGQLLSATLSSLLVSPRLCAGNYRGRAVLMGGIPRPANPEIYVNALNSTPPRSVHSAIILWSDCSRAPSIIVWFLAVMPI
jgi:hypothetical protein